MSGKGFSEPTRTAAVAAVSELVEDAGMSQQQAMVFVATIIGAHFNTVRMWLEVSHVPSASQRRLAAAQHRAMVQERVRGALARAVIAAGGGR